MVMICGCLWAKEDMTLCRAEIRTYHLPDDERFRYVLRHGRGFITAQSYIFICPEGPQVWANKPGINSFIFILIIDENILLYTMQHFSVWIIIS